ncbi:MAG TPA: type II secretion system F family protein [Candidatus Tyrphobacter sp.]|nr:type II secretion system F family protein [Candidatus Tyrphobacter sp.]
MRFHYVAADPNGRMVEGYTEAKDTNDVLAWMGNQGLRPVSLKIIQGGEKKALFGDLFSQPITITDQVFLTRYLALMLRAGTDLFHAIDILVEDFDKPSVKMFLVEVRDSLSKGQPFYKAFMSYSKYFSPVFISMIRAGEASGNLEKVFGDLSISLDKQQDINNRIRSALVYPAILIFMSLGVLLLLVTFVLPKIANTFLTSGFNPPLFSKIVFTIGLFVGQNVFIVYPALFILAAVLWYFFGKTETGKKVLSESANRVPVIKDLLQKIALQRFLSTFASLLKAGMPIIDALEITSETTGSDPMKLALLRISREGVAKGLTIGESFRREMIFPRTVTSLILISEKAGHLETILDTLADFYDSEISSSIKTLLSFLEPALLLIMGLIVGSIALSIIVPIYQLTSKI